MTDYIEHHVASARTIVFAFASADTRHFEWGITLSALPVSYVLIRDGTDHWYTRGIAGWGDFHDSVRRINRIAEPYDRTIALGTSKGAYGALLYAAYALLDEVIAISPVSNRAAYLHPFSEFMDLCEVYRTRPPVWLRSFVSDGNGCHDDLHQATRLGQGSVCRIPGHDHDKLARHMVNTGIIKELLTCASTC